MGRHGVRSPWSDVPASVREAIAGIAGSPIVHATNIEGGFSPGPTARCTLLDGRVVFVKAAGTELDAASPAMHRREGQILASLHDDVAAPSP